MLWLLLLQVSVSCLWLGHSEVVTSFASCSRFFYQGTTPNEALEPQNPALICQRYNNSYHFATLYDRKMRIPIYSAYIYQPGTGNRSKSWFVEPQLIGKNNLKEMETQSTLIDQHKFTLQQIKQSQAVLEDYENLKGLDHGHLSPSGHQSGNNSKSAAFTLTNIVPQDSSLNNGAWNIYEFRTMANNSKSCTTTYVIVGAVPGNTYIASQRVNKPSHIWSAACCVVGQKPMKTWAVIAENDKNQVQNLTLKELEANLSQLYGRGQVSLFHSACPR
ncbi:ENDD1 protein, partial [Dasyornis broadbenti]|nr:ENDD1 protein [Dasyornis broadbenti]